MCLVAKKICKSNLIKGLKRKLEKKNPKKILLSQCLDAKKKS